MIGLNAELLKNYVEWIGAKRMRAVGLTAPATSKHIGQKNGR